MLRRALLLLLAAAPAWAGSSARTAPIGFHAAPHPPNLTAEVRLEEPSDNRALDALEEGALVVTFANTGQGDAYDVAVRARWEGSHRGVTLAERTPVGTVAAGARREVRMQLAAAEDTPDQTLKLTLEFPEGSGFDADPVTLSFATRAFAPPKLVLADYRLDDAGGNGQVEPGELVEVTARVQNMGAGDAVGVTAQVQLGANVFLGAGAQPSHTLGNLLAGAHTDLTFSFYTNKRIRSGEAVPVALALAEGRGRFAATESLDIVANAPARRARELVVESVPQPGGGAAERVGGLSVDVDREIPKGKVANPKAVAVVIGNRTYRHTSPVEFAANDAATVKRYLVETLGYDPANILYAEDADLTLFNTLFGTATNPRGKLHQWVRPGESDVFVYYSGHGVPSQEEGGSPYFVTSNADPNFIAAGGYAVALFRTNLEALPARSLTVVVDACFSGTTAAGELLLRDVSPAALKVKKDLPAPAGALFMASAAAEEVSTWYRAKNHSTFTYWWLKGIGGAADTDGNRAITVAELKTYLDREVPYTARRETGQTQTPVILGEPDQVVVQLR